ncbi:hypothetical protein CARUB_v10007885mg [Capsella rubella]|uniref:Uncharacterized protein n=1 Tax=Capsella rubella TaxID=81985 RepID=R0ETE4_9BRAS|nr:hypothetical protein CARUB_v10007885mg [Capsella rubella]
MHCLQLQLKHTSVPEFSTRLLYQKFCFQTVVPKNIITTPGVPHKIADKRTTSSLLQKSYQEPDAPSSQLLSQTSCFVEPNALLGPDFPTGTCFRNQKPNCLTEAKCSIRSLQSQQRPSVPPGTLPPHQRPNTPSGDYSPYRAINSLRYSASLNNV